MRRATELPFEEDPILLTPDHLVRGRTLLAAYAEPGGYPVIYILSGGDILCPDCADDYLREAALDALEGDTGCSVYGNDDIIEAHSIHFEGPPEMCGTCGEMIESAYGDPDDPDEEGPHCRVCGGAMMITGTGVSHHQAEEGGVDHDMDARHVAVADDERE